VRTKFESGRMSMTNRIAAARLVTYNWRIRQRLPRITALAIRLRFIANADTGKDMGSLEAIRLRVADLKAGE
jgi:hypothetical protein